MFGHHSMHVDHVMSYIESEHARFLEVHDDKVWSLALSTCKNGAVTSRSLDPAPNDHQGSQRK
jgi:hypothetical protein